MKRESRELVDFPLCGKNRKKHSKYAPETGKQSNHLTIFQGLLVAFLFIDNQSIISVRGG